MAIQQQTPPVESLQALEEAADHLHPAHSAITDMLNQAHDRPSEHLPHPVYAVGLDDMASGDGLKKARVIGWRYLAESSGGRNYLIEVHQTPDGFHRFGGVEKGPLVEAMLKVIDEAKLDQKISSGVYTLAVLAIQALGVFALWLNANEVDAEIVVVPPAPRGLQPWPTTYTVEQFEEALRVEAQSKLAYDVSAFV